MKTNPYIADKPVGGNKAFIGRKDVLHDVLKMLKNPNQNALVLFGQRRIGKTSILQELAYGLPKEGSYLPVYFDLQGKATLSLQKVLGNLADQIVRDLKIPEFHKWMDNSPEEFREVYLPQILEKLPYKSTLVLLFDEFDVFDNPTKGQAANDFFPYLRTILAMSHARLKLIFVIGRRTEDLANLTSSVFKGLKSRHVSLLSVEDTTTLIRISEENKSLHWPWKIIMEVYSLTGGHPFLTQHLCETIWEQLYKNTPTNTPNVKSEDVQLAVSKALRSANTALEWFWDGLKTAERIVASTLAEGDSKEITQDELEKRLQDLKIKISTDELLNAPRILQNWDLLESVNGNGYRFRIELLRRWIAKRKPVTLIQEEMNRVLHIAENLFHAANKLYDTGEVDEAIPILKRAIGFNPNHLKANQLLVEIYSTNGEIIKARNLLDSFYKYQPQAARSLFVQTLLIQAKKLSHKGKALEFYEKVLQIMPNQPEALIQRQKILEEFGDKALNNNKLEEALEFYKKAKLTKKVNLVRDKFSNLQTDFVIKKIEEIERSAEYETLLNNTNRLLGKLPDEENILKGKKGIKKDDLNKKIEEILKFESEQDYKSALKLAVTLHNQYPDEENLPNIKSLQKKLKLENLYQQAIVALKNKDNITAQKLLVKVVSIEVTYKEATRFLHLAVTGEDLGIRKSTTKIGEIVELTVNKAEKTPINEIKKRQLNKPIISGSFRKQPGDLSSNDVIEMFNRYGFFDKYKNKEGRGFDNQFEEQTLKGNKVILDRASNLIWQQGGSHERMTIKDAKVWIKKLNQNGYAGYNDWRLPTLEEAMSLLEPEKKNDLYIDPKFSRRQHMIWTADLVHLSNAAWVVSFNDGYCYRYIFYTDYYVRAVRSG